MSTATDKAASPWSVETIIAINKLTPGIKGKEFDPDWFLLRERLEQYEAEHAALVAVADYAASLQCSKIGLAEALAKLREVQS